VRRLLVPLVAAGLVAGAAASPAAATNECNGLQVCVPVAGPWVALVPQHPVPVEFQLSCPKGYVVGGLDSELSVREIDVSFRGLNGSPVSPGTTTSQDAVFTATYVGTGAPAPSFRPHIGCVPTAGGGGRIPTAFGVFPPGRATVRHVRDVRVIAGAHRIALGCAVNERLVGGSHAVGFFTAAPPGAGLFRSVVASRVVRQGHVVVSVRATAGVTGTRAIVQVGALCAPEQ
jgi:hypothetical protein